MDAHDLFRRLGVGAKFDVRRFSADAARFQVLCAEQVCVTEKAQEPENDLAAGRAGTQRPRPGLGALPLFLCWARAQTYRAKTCLGVNSYYAFIDLGGTGTETLHPSPL